MEGAGPGVHARKRMTALLVRWEIWATAPVASRKRRETGGRAGDPGACPRAGAYKFGHSAVFLGTSTAYSRDFRLNSSEKRPAHLALFFRAWAYSGSLWSWRHIVAVYWRGGDGFVYTIA